MNHIELEDIHIDFVESTKALGININLQGFIDFALDHAMRVGNAAF